jgi:glutamate N-acetyltransferase / amino-acid N-acetyltransferase
MKQITGGVTAAKGFQAASTAAGIKYKDRKDMAMIYSEVPCKAAGTFTTNIVKAAPVKWDHNVVYNSKAAQVLSLIKAFTLSRSLKSANFTPGISGSNGS